MHGEDYHVTPTFIGQYIHENHDESSKTMNQQAKIKLRLVSLIQKTTNRKRFRHGDTIIADNTYLLCK